MRKRKYKDLGPKPIFYFDWDKHVREMILFTKIVGIAVAATLSWSRNESVIWAVCHGFLSWGYLGWYAIFESWKHV